MTAMQVVLYRIATATSVIRTRSEDATRQQYHGNGEAAEQVRDVIKRLEKVAAELERALA